MQIANFMAETIQRVFSDPSVASTQVSTTSLIERAMGEPIVVVLFLTIVLSVCSFLMALIVFFRRPPTSIDDDLLDQRLQIIEALLRDHAAARAYLTKKMTGEAEFFRLELADIRSSLERIETPSLPRKKISNGP